MVKEVKYYGIDGKEVVEEPKFVCAKYVLTDKGERYEVLMNGGNLFDPRNTDRSYKFRKMWSLRSVTYSLFDLYIRFLQTKYKTLLLQAERLI